MFIYTRYVKLDTKIHLVLVDLSSAFEGPKLKLNWTIYEGCPESIQPFCISREPTAWTWCNVAASQRRPYCASVNSHSPVGLVSRQWDAVDWACVLFDRLIHKSPPFQRRFYLWEKPEFAGSQMWAVGGLTDLGDVMLCQKKPVRELYNGQAHCRDEADLLARSLWMRRSHSTQS